MINIGRQPLTDSPMQNKTSRVNHDTHDHQVLHDWDKFGSSDKNDMYTL